LPGVAVAMTVRSRAVRICVVLIIYAGYMLYSNPIRFHQTAHAGGLTMQVPSTWTPMKSAAINIPVALHREWSPFLPFGNVSVVDHSAFPRSSGSWTMETARKMQTGIVAARSKVTAFSNTSTFDLKAGDRTAVCIEMTLSGRSRILNCTIVGTTLQFIFTGSRFAEPSAERMLASLN
jgi:hypothetical protein